MCVFCVVCHSVVCHSVCIVQSAIVHVFRTKCYLQHTWSPCALAVTNWKGIPCSTFQRVGDIHGRGWQCKTTIVLLSTSANDLCLLTDMCQVHGCSCARTSCHFPISLKSNTSCCISLLEVLLFPFSVCVGLAQAISGVSFLACRYPKPVA